MALSVILVDLLARLFGVVRSIVNPHYLGAIDYGRLGVLSAFLLFASFCDLGVIREFEIHYPQSRSPRDAFRKAVRRFVGRALPMALVLSTLIGIRFDGWIALACLPYFLAFNFGEICSIVARAHGRVRALNLYTLLSALALTTGAIWVAPRYGVLGLMILQSAVVAISALVFYRILRDWVGAPFEHALPTQEATSAEESGRGARWLLLGQFLPLAWLTLDRFFLSTRISAQELGYWTLGTLPVSLLVGVANAAGSLFMADWIHRKRPYLRRSEALGFGSIVAVGVLAYGPFVRWMLPEYAPGVDWNRRLILTQAGIAALFFYDAYRRSGIRDARDARAWFNRKLAATGTAFAISIGLGPWILPQEPRAWVLAGFHGLLVGIWCIEKRWTMLLIQLALIGVTLL